MTCLHCQHNRPQRVSDGFYRAQCVLGYPEAMDAGNGLIDGSTAMSDCEAGSAEESLRVAHADAD